MTQSGANKKVIIGMVVALFLILVPISFFLFKEAPVTPDPTEPIMQSSTTQPTSQSTSSTTVPNPCAGGHNYVSGVCANCGVVDGNYIPTTNSTTPINPSSSQTTKPSTPSFDVNGTFTITQNGVAKAAIVVAQSPTSEAEAAAADLRDYIQRMSGATLEIIRTDATLTANKFYILVGGTKQATSLGVSQPTGYPDNEKLIIKRIQNYLILTGNDDRAFTGTEFAVTRFLEELGCGWFAPTDQPLWTVVPEKATITINQMDITETPKFISRDNYNLNSGRPGQIELCKRWYMGGVSAKVGQHFLMAAVGQGYQSTNPEWYAKKSNGSLLYPDGNQSAWPDIYWQFCYSNQGLIEKVAQTVKDYFAINPDYMTYSITPNDGFHFRTCECSGCAAYASETDLILSFANRVGEIVGRTYPDRVVSVLAYHPTMYPPVNNMDLNKNAEVMFCTETHMLQGTSTVSYYVVSGSKQNTPWGTNFKNYISKAGLDNVAIWKWLCVAAEGTRANWRYVPWVQGNVATNDQNFWKQNGARYVFYDQGPSTGYKESTDSFALRWPLWYVAQRGCWTQDKSGEELLMDACQKLYGKGATAMFNYYKKLADIAGSNNTWPSYAWYPPTPTEVYGAYESQIDSLIATAESMLNQVSAVEKQRMQVQINLWKTAKNYI